MKEIKAIVQSHVAGKVLDAMRALSHFPGVTISTCEGLGRGRGEGGRFEPTVDNFHLAQHTKIEVFCADAESDQIVRAIERAAHTGHAGDGVIMIADLERVVRIRSGQEQNEAV